MRDDVVCGGAIGEIGLIGKRVVIDEVVGAVEVDTVGSVVADDVAHDGGGGAGGCELDACLSVTIDVVVGDEIVVGVGEHADVVMADLVVGDRGMGRAELDAGAFVAMNEVVQKQGLSDRADSDAVCGGAGDVAARDGGATVKDGVSVACEDDAVAASIANGDRVDVDFGGGFGIDAGEVGEVALEHAAGDGDLALAGDGDQAASGRSGQRSDGAV